MAEPETRTPEGLLTEAAKARTEAGRYHRAGLMVHDDIVEETLLQRESELIN
jgi:hypothetical protein